MSRLGRLFRRGRLERHLDAELTDHLERQVADYRSAGLSEDEARRQASLAFGSTEQGLNDLRQQYSSPLRLLMAAVAALLLMACANLASLILARTRAREHEVALRLAVGASRGRVARQLLTEALVLAAVGGAVGLALAYWGSHAIVMLLSRGRSPIQLDLGVDARLLGFTAVLSVLTSLLFGIWPAWTAVRSNGHPGLRTGERAVARTNRVSVLVAIQSALSIVLLISAMLFARTLLNLHRVDTGLDKRQVLLVRVRSEAAGSTSSASRFHEELQTRLASRPGVRSVTRSMDIPFGGSSYRASVAVPGEAVREDEQVNYNFVGPGFFETMGIALAAGRDFEPADDSTSWPVAVISQSLARRYFPGRDAVGSHLVAGKAVVEIVGVARDISYAGVREEKELVIYRPLLQDARANAGGIFAIRADLPPAAIADLVRQTLRETAPDVAISSMTLEAQFDGSIATERLMASIAGFFAVTALLLVAVGVYGTLASLVVRRTRELGIRLALGASRRSIAILVLGGALSPVALGLLLGLPIALAGVRLARSVLFGITPSDPVTYLGSAIVLVVVAAAAAALPALSATRADPMAALRQE